MATKGGLVIDPGDEIGKLLDKVQELEKPRRTLENAVMRGLSYNAAVRLVPLVERAVNSSPAPQARGVASTVRAKRDRMIVVRVGAVKPALSGFRGRGGGRAKSSWSTTVAYGVALGPQSHSVSVSSFQRRPRGRSRRGGRYTVRAHTRSYGNPYRVGRRGNQSDPFSGYMSGYRERIVEQAGEEYADIILEVMRRNGWPID